MSRNQLAVAEREEIARAIRALLRSPLLAAAADPVLFDVIRRRREPLIRWFDYYCGWRLVVEPRQGYARLVKVRAEAGGSRPARRRRPSRAPFDRRRYTLFCLACAELLAARGGPAVTTAGMLARRVARAAAAEPVVPDFDPDRADERAAFADALRLLEHYGVLAATDGATDAYLADRDAKVLYRVDATRAVRLLAAPVSPARVDVGEWPAPSELAALATETRYGTSDEPPTETQRALWVRHSLIRRLLDDPVVYRGELTAAQSAYLASPSGRQIVRKAAEEAGFVLEDRAEGLLLVDPEGLSTDSRFPDDGSHARVAALLLLDRLVTQGPQSVRGLQDEVTTLLGRFPQWAKAYRSEGGPPRLVEDALDVLVLFGLVHRSEGMITPLPAAARYRVAREEA